MDTLERVVAILVDAAIHGDRQARGALHSRYGVCALGVVHRLVRDHRCGGRLAEAGLCVSLGLPELTRGRPRDCGECSFTGSSLGHLIVHWNDEHGWDFLTIAWQLDRMRLEMPLAPALDTDRSPDGTRWATAGP